MTNPLIKTYLFESEETLKLPQGRIKTNYLAKEGIYELSSSWIGEKCVLVSEHALGDLTPFPEEYIGVSIFNKKNVKIPAEALETVISWYSHVTKMTGEEAQVNFYISKGPNDTLTKPNGEIISLRDIPGITYWNNSVFSYTPKQKNSQGLTTSVDPLYDLLNTQYGMFVETHSHNSMSAFKSAEDAANSNNDALQLVFGRLETPTPEMFSWVTIRGTQIDGLYEKELENFIEFPAITEPPSSFYKGKGKTLPTSNGKYYFDTTAFSGKRELLFSEWDAQVIHNSRKKKVVVKTDTIYDLPEKYKKTSHKKGKKKKSKKKESKVTIEYMDIDTLYKTSLVTNRDFREFYINSISSLNKAYKILLQSHPNFNKEIVDWNINTYVIDDEIESEKELVSRLNKLVATYHKKKRK